MRQLSYGLLVRVKGEKAKRMETPENTQHCTQNCMSEKHHPNASIFQSCLPISALHSRFSTFHVHIQL